MGLWHIALFAFHPIKNPTDVTSSFTAPQQTGTLTRGEYDAFFQALGVHQGVSYRERTCCRRASQDRVATERW